MKTLVNFSDIDVLTFIDDTVIQLNCIMHSNELVKYV
ncbi:hypothetical protein M2093_001565 [Breznakia sp. PH1-1]|nr:hypothetical protein [Breznakia sp. PH1-1]MDH6403942.1 hypothetical protein [Breznakia sp. PF1-11]MDH6411651.1 hypothetical protein [Breznakia sp. PFB1-11]MDH6414577.1 hypothetical protein [Breznakia sp. PFB1-14]MDH6416002.1 hypothetical protein [Breznakia sp. PFB1-4]MDH6418683.1 hypothetical protein [Breznakia sp. PFB1-12]MDH6473493.1 hypothetical protein [Breznakia sp. PFB2-30]MDH6475929.1 hypothetical protein [Breznakia sp. PFB1-19]